MDSLSQVLRAYGSTASIQPSSNHAYSYILRGEAYNLKKRYQEALAAYEQAIRLDPNSGSNYRGKGDALFGLGRRNEAQQFYEKASQLGYVT